MPQSVAKTGKEPDRENLYLQVVLKGEEVEKWQTIRDHTGLKINSEVMRHIIGDYHRRHCKKAANIIIGS